MEPELYPGLVTRGGETQFYFSFLGIWALIKGIGSVQNMTDLGLPTNGHDGVFLSGPPWAGDMPPMPEAR